jgi:C-lobe and N-lobe beta barrels of Tf-binding protein B
MKPMPSVAVLALSLVTCACGGGSSGGSVASAPAPVPSPTPSPTQSPGFTPTVTPTETLAGTTAARAIISQSGEHEEILDASRVSIGRDASGNYLITLPVITGQTVGMSEGFLRRFEFLAANRTVTASGAQQFALGRSGSIFPNEKSLLTILPARTAANPLNYMNFASLQLSLADEVGFGDPAIPNGNAIVFGTRTAASDIPLTGSAGYSGTFATSYANRGVFVCDPVVCDGTAGGGLATFGQLAGDLRLTVNFADKGISGSLSNITDSTGWFSYTATDANHLLANLAMTGAFLADGTLSGTFAAAPGTPFTGGIWNGMFFGPQAVEVGGSMILRANLGATTEYAGWFGGKKD